ncbi:hypothetical protein MICAF_7770003 [Microcystis aeruginosa PCC 9807]|uniref:Uncharacterized protein n=1 Tax=Microcystis aeruginosa PCC 9807 TaxID=1160283 RepID=I4HEN6_MICAE|nr:hypothetical protein [Microcystis aeruginosa]CCI20510.1 hypothetical protein MICAF_7770003 [Microcystis aeruginosa PCC 9807]
MNEENFFRYKYLYYWSIKTPLTTRAKEIFLSENRELIKIIADFDCLTSEEFLDKYLRQMPP